MARRKTTEDIIAEFKRAHGERYDYSLVEYKNAHTPVRIICAEHGEFLQSPHHHKRGRGCPACGTDRAAKAVRGTRRTKMNTAAFVKRAREVHGDKYDYSLAEFDRSDRHVRIVCPEHGPFLQVAREHLRGRGCPKCAKRGAQPGQAHPKAISLGEFLRRAEQAHGKRYIIDEESYTVLSRKVRVFCRQHGWFDIQAKALVLGQGCRKCAEIRKTRLYRRVTKTTEQFVREAINVHGDKYNYTKVRYRGAFSPVVIICPDHGPFAQMPSNHIRGSGCPRCASTCSAGEQAVREHFADLGAVSGGRKLLGGLEIDVWLPAYRVGIEYHGSLWHSTYKVKDRYRHAKKASAAEKAGIRLFQVFDDEWANKNKRDIISDLVMRACKKAATKISARACSLELITATEADSFFSTNHLQGGVGRKAVALLYEGEIMFAASFGRRFGKFELLRCASKIGSVVVGGLARILAHLPDFHPGEDVLWSFVDRRFFTGASLLREGFSVQGVTPPGYVYVNGNGEVLGGRTKFQKHMLKAFLGEAFDPALTEEENMRQAGFYRRYDAGHLLLRRPIS